MGWMTQHFLLHEGPEEHIRSLLVAAGGWNAQLHQEILVWTGNYWQKDHGLWTEVQKANWEDVILKEKFKSDMQKDINGFFESEDLYKSLAIPWKVRRTYDWHTSDLNHLYSVVSSCMGPQVSDRTRVTNTC